MSTSTPPSSTPSSPSRPKLPRFISKLGSSSRKARASVSESANELTAEGTGSSTPTSSSRLRSPSDSRMTSQLVIRMGPLSPSPSERFSFIDFPDVQELFSTARPPFSRASSKKVGLLPRIWSVLSLPRKTNKLLPMYDNEGNLLPLGGEEGELVEDEGWFDVVVPDSTLSAGKLDIIGYLPTEISLAILLYLDLPSVLSAASVSKTWYRLANDKVVWRQLFYRQPTWKVDLTAASRKRISSRASSLIPSSSSLYKRWSRVSHRSASPPCLAAPNLSLDWTTMYKTRFEIERRWVSAEPRLSRLSGHTDSVYCLEFDCHKIITGSRDQTIKIWSLHTGKTLGTLRGHEGSVLCLKFESSSGFLVSGSSDRSILVWDLNSLKSDGTTRPKAVLKGHTGGVLDLKLDKDWIVSCSKDATVRVWSRATLSFVCAFAGHEGPVNAVGLHAGQIISASGDGTMILWSIAKQTRIRTFAGHSRGLACVCFASNIVISGSNDESIRVWDVKTGECLQTLNGHTALVRALAYDEEVGRLVSASYDQSVIVWDLERNGTGDAKIARVFKGHHTSHIFDVKFDTTRIMSASLDQKIAILDFAADLDMSLLA